MTSTDQDRGAFKVVIGGGGVAALEGALALRECAGGAVSLTLLAPERDFFYRPLAVREPFAHSRAVSYPLAAFAKDVGATLVSDSFAWVDPARRLAHTGDGLELGYDALLLALGAKARVRYQHALTVDDHHLDALMHGLIQDIEDGYVHSVAFVVPPRLPWPLPIYELATMTAGRAYDMDVDLAVTIITPEERPLALFGQEAAAGVQSLLDEARIQTITAAYAEVPRRGCVTIHPGDRQLEVERVVALPELFGPAVRGLPAAEHGFIPTDGHGQVRGAERVYAAGDATDFPVKHGGVAAEQADVAAEAIAALAGFEIECKGFEPVVRGILLTDGRPKYLTAQITGGHGCSSSISDTPTWDPPSKIAARYLSPYLDRHASLRRAKVA
jgi:sulfide:quinone oxidoreductase